MAAGGRGSLPDRGVQPPKSRTRTAVSVGTARTRAPQIRRTSFLSTATSVLTVPRSVLTVPRSVLTVPSVEIRLDRREIRLDRREIRLDRREVVLHPVECRGKHLDLVAKLGDDTVADHGFHFLHRSIGGHRVSASSQKNAEQGAVRSFGPGRRGGIGRGARSGTARGIVSGCRDGLGFGVGWLGSWQVVFPPFERQTPSLRIQTETGSVSSRVRG